MKRSQKGGVGGGGPAFGKNSQIIPYFFFERLPKSLFVLKFLSGGTDQGIELRGQLKTLVKSI